MADTGEVGDRWDVIGPHGERETIVRVQQWIYSAGQRLPGMPILRTVGGAAVSELADRPPGTYLIHGVEYTKAP